MFMGLQGSIALRAGIAQVFLYLYGPGIGKLAPPLLITTRDELKEHHTGKCGANAKAVQNLSNKIPIQV